MFANLFTAIIRLKFYFILTLFSILVYVQTLVKKEYSCHTQLYFAITGALSLLPS